ncbi:hypothetical protein QP456_11145 [Corynebacterium amycolatum]|uniref:hypothetical protein n=1 Tax=Corynebacterium amycolatum TaxID=43765 RepID=UPI00254F6C8F|nr:hypothetical protein [Corynebacterium amycolatum]MDK7238680.1 hypothetical protein [Corynebacterium amycolatum]MDK7248765.1 hypothetical protein [Corynebacterium amycolatum]
MNHVIELPDDDGTGFDAGDLGTAWLPFTEPRAKDLEQLAIALIQHAQEMDAAALKEIADEYRNHCLANGDDNTVAWIDRKRGEQ